jgi:hypothetical protein
MRLAYVSNGASQRVGVWRNTQLACSATLLLDTLGSIPGMSHDTNTFELHESGTPGQKQHHNIKTSTRIFTEDFLTFLTVLTFYNSHFHAHLT